MYTRSLRRPELRVALLLAALWLLAFRAATAQVTRFYLELSPCDALKILRAVSAVQAPPEKHGYPGILGTPGQCLTVLNADGVPGSDPSAGPMKAGLTVEGGDVAPDGTKHLKVHWDGGALIEPVPITSTGGFWSYRVDGDPTVPQPTGELWMYPDPSDPHRGAATGFFHLATRLVFMNSEGKDEAETPLALDFSIGGSWSIASAAPEPVILIYSSGDCFDVRPDCLRLHYGWNEGLGRSTTTYCYCSDCTSPTPSCGKCSDPWCAP